MKSSRPLAKLPITLANQIAAGEVIERPANVIKELLENSLDAGATKIVIDVSQAGIKDIVIRDNGIGMAKEDLPLAVAQHATSKIASLEDLERVETFGFRGEALASISSVSEMSIASCQQEGAAHILKSHPDNGFQIEPVAHPVGTTMTVQHLFFNVPARRKFLKSEQTERLHIENTIKRIALSRFDVGITYRYENKTILQLPPCTHRAQEEARIAAIMGENFIKKAVYLETEASGLTLRGWFYHDASGFSHNEFQAFLVNGRFVKDKVFNHALRQATLTFLEPGRFAGFVLNLNLDPKLVDVNVHPTKSEVRFRYPSQVHDFLQQTLARVVNTDLPEMKAEIVCEESQEQTSHHAYRNESSEPSRMGGVFGNHQSAAQSQRWGEPENEKTKFFPGERPEPARGRGRSRSEDLLHPSYEEQALVSPSLSSQNSTSPSCQKLTSSSCQKSAASQGLDESESPSADCLAPSHEDHAYKAPDPKISIKSLNISRLFNRFIMVHRDDGPLLIDAVTLKKREFLSALMQPISKKPLLMPVAFSIQRGLEPHVQEAQSFFDITQSAEDQYLIRAVPRCCDIQFDAATMLQFLEKLQSLGTVKASEWLAEYWAQHFVSTASTDKLNTWLNTVSFQENNYVKTLSIHSLMGLFE